MTDHKAHDVELTERGWTGVCSCGKAVYYTGTIRDGAWVHR